MVYSIRCNAPIVSSSPVKRRRIQGEHSKNVEELVKNYYISVSRDENGKPIIRLSKIYD